MSVGPRREETHRPVTGHGADSPTQLGGKHRYHWVTASFGSDQRILTGRDAAVTIGAGRSLLNCSPSDLSHCTERGGREAYLAV
jgi:hypothetical protein